MVWRLVLQTDCVRSGSCHLPTEPVLTLQRRLLWVTSGGLPPAMTSGCPLEADKVRSHREVSNVPIAALRRLTGMPRAPMQSATSKAAGATIRDINAIQRVLRRKVDTSG
jgi:hypothetical protein